MREIEETGMNQIIEFNEFESKLAEFKKQYDGVVYDLTVPEQEKQARSDRFAIAKVISRLDEAHKALKAPLKEKVDLIDGERKRIKDDLLSVQDKIKSQIDAHEAKIQDHEEELQRRVDEIRLLVVFQNDLTEFPYSPDSNEVNNRLAILAKIDVDDTFEHRKADGTLAHVETGKRLNTLLAERLKVEQEAEELERLRKEAEARERADREERIRQEATAAAEAKAKAEQERAEARIKETEARRVAAEEKAKQDALEAAERAKKEQSEAVARAEKAERERLAKEQAVTQAKAETERKADEARKAKAKHRKKIEGEAIDCLVAEIFYCDSISFLHCFLGFLKNP